MNFHKVNSPCGQHPDQEIESDRFPKSPCALSESLPPKANSTVSSAYSRTFCSTVCTLLHLASFTLFVRFIQLLASPRDSHFHDTSSLTPFKNIIISLLRLEGWESFCQNQGAVWVKETDCPKAWCWVEQWDVQDTENRHSFWGRCFHNYDHSDSSQLFLPINDNEINVPVHILLPIGVFISIGSIFQT